MRIFTFGCSFTEGQGLENHIKECYSNKLSEKLKIKHFNFGSCGASNDYIFRKVFELINSNIIAKDDIIIIQWTHYIRKELPIMYNDSKWYHYVPTAEYPFNDKIIVKDGQFDSAVKNSDYNIDYKENRIEILNKIKDKNKKLLDEYIFNFIDEEYQYNTTRNYINSLYTYLEHFGYQHIHFFGFKKCIIKDVYKNKKYFLNDNFGEFTNTIGNEHPDKEGHLNWANYLYEKIKEFNFNTEINLI